MTTDAWRAVSELAASQHGCFSTAQAAVPLTTLQSWRRRGRIATPLPGAHVILGAPVSWRVRLMLATLAFEHAVISHRAAAALHGLDGIEVGPLELTLPRHEHRRIDGFVVHTTDSLTRSDVVTVDGIRVTGLARTAADLGAVVDDRLVERVADDVARRTSFKWVEQTLERVDRPGPSGTGSLRRVLSSTPDLGKTDTWFERLVIDALRSAGFDVVAQYKLCDQDGVIIASFDAAIPSVRLGIESHSKRWHFGARKNVVDAERDARVSALDWDIVYVFRPQADDPDEVLRKVLPIIEGRSWRSA